MHSITRGFMGRGEEVKKVRGLACALLYVAFTYYEKVSNEIPHQTTIILLLFCL